jgi:hypothetical protein
MALSVGFTRFVSSANATQVTGSNFCPGGTVAKLEPSRTEVHRKECVKEAEKAVELSDEKKFFTWWEHVDTFPPTPIAAAASIG